MKIGIITAMQVEHDQIAALLTDCAELPAPSFGAPPVLTGRLGDHTVVLAMSGIGKVNAALTAASLIAAHRPDAMISTGCARLLAVARDLADDPAVETPVCCGLTCTGDKFITDPAELKAVLGAFPEALAVDMESAAIAHACHLHNVPFLSFRVISDMPGAEAHWEQYQDFWGTMADRSFGITRTFLSRIPATF